jgi:hypothetical protein
MAAYSGKNGLVKSGSTQLAEITGWKLSTKSNNPAWNSSTSSGSKKRVAGVKDGSGSFDLKVDDSDEIYDTLVEGDSVTLNLYLNATKFFAVPALIDNIDYDVDINDGEVVAATVAFSTNGAWTKPA